MSSLLQLVGRMRAWRIWRSLRRPLAAPAAPTPFLVSSSRPILRDVTAQGVRVYSLCGSCGTHLGASATLCDACARARPMRNV
jgi:hypothetical protein